MKLICTLDEDHAQDPAHAGSKAARLAALTRHRGDCYEVPGGFGVPTDAVDRVLVRSVIASALGISSRLRRLASS